MADEIRNYVLAIILFTAFIVGGVALISELARSNATMVQDERFARFNESFNTYADVSSSVGSLEANIRGGNASFGLFGGLNALIVTSWNTMKLTYTSYSFMDNVFSGSEYLFGIPNWVSGLIIIAISVMISFAILAYIFRST